MSVQKWSKDVGAGDTVKALSLWEPWATLMAIGAKTIETRHWLTRYRGPLLICATKTTPRGAREAALGSVEIMDALRDRNALWPDGRLRPGHALALVDLYDCCSTQSLLETETNDQYDQTVLGDFSYGRYGFLTNGLRRLKPFPVTGRQGLFNVTLPSDLKEW